MSNKAVILDEAARDAWTELVSMGINNALSGLSQMIGREIIVSTLNAQMAMIRDVPDLLGGAEVETAAVYLSVAGVASGHMVLLYHPETALGLVDLLMDEPPGTSKSVGAMEESVLAEMGNIVGSFFLNAVADATKLDLRVSPPAVMIDMAGAILDAVLAEMLAETDEALILKTSFGTADRQIRGTFLCMPSAGMQSALLDRWMAQ